MRGFFGLSGDAPESDEVVWEDGDLHVNELGWEGEGTDDLDEIDEDGLDGGW